jgi:hypothetical protein
MECSLHQALQGTLAGAGPAGQLAAFLRRAV